MFALLRHGVSSDSGLFHQRGVLLGNLIHLVDGDADFTNPLMLLGRGSGNLRDNIGHFINRGDDLLHRPAGGVCITRAVGNFMDGPFDKLLNFFRGVGTFLRQSTHFTGDHGKTFTLFTGAGGFNGGVERQDVGLESNPFNHRNDIDDFLRAVGDFMHPLEHIVHFFSAFYGGL